MGCKISNDPRFPQSSGGFKWGDITCALTGLDRFDLELGHLSIHIAGDLYGPISAVSNLVKSYHGADEVSLVDALAKGIDGRFSMVLRNSKTNEIFVANDFYGRQCLFFNETEGVFITDELSAVSDTVNPVLDNFATAHVIMTSTGPRAPKRHSPFKALKGLGLHQVLKVSNDSVSVIDLKIPLKPMKHYGSRELEQYGKTFLETIEKLGSKEENIVYLSSGWDSTTILAALNHVFGPKTIKAVTWRLTISDRSEVFNKFEIERAQKFSDFYKVPLFVHDTNYVTDGARMHEEIKPFLQKHGYHAYTAFSHYFTAKKASEIKATTSPALFSGEISDGAHNLGFAQYISTFHPSPGFREYSDKMFSYLFGPTFLNECVQGRGDADAIFQFLKTRYASKKFEPIAKDEKGLLKQILSSFFGRNERFPFVSIENYKILTPEGRRSYQRTLETDYLDPILEGIDTRHIYSAFMRLYSSFHWNGSSVNTLYSTAEHFGLKMRLPFYDPAMINMFEEMPEDWGRGLDLNNVKYPLKQFLGTINYPFELQSGPHSYLYDVDPKYLNPPYEWVMHSMRSTYLKCIENFPLERLDRSFFEVDYIQRVLTDYKNGKVADEDFSSLYGYLNFVLTQAH